MWGNILLWFSLAFGDWWCWTSFHVPVGHLYVFFGEIPIRVFGLFFSVGYLVFFSHCVVAIPYIFWILAPYQIHGLQIFSPPSIGCLFTLLILYLSLILVAVLISFINIYVILIYTIFHYETVLYAYSPDSHLNCFQFFAMTCILICTSFCSCASFSSVHFQEWNYLAVGMHIFIFIRYYQIALQSGWLSLTLFH